MERIDVDDDVFAYLQKHAQPFVDTPNSTLRRLLGIDVGSVAPDFKSKPPIRDDELDNLSEEVMAQRRSKAPKADLKILVQNGFLRNGQTLYLVDYQGNRLQDVFAVISGNDLVYMGHLYSMSNLAQELLTKVGFASNAVRGPAHWVTENGKSIKDLWQEHLERKGKN